MFDMSDTMSRIRSIDVTRPGAWGLFLRHAERHPIVKPSDVLSAGLTDAGRESAHRMGRSLSAVPIGAVLSSPVHRCIDTALHILKGYGSANPQTDPRLQVDDTLLQAFIEDGRLAEIEYSRNDPQRVILDHLTGQNVPGLVSLKIGVARLLHFSMRRLTERSVTLFITHDSILMPFRAHLCDARYDTDQWQPFLTGALIHRIGDTLTVDGVPLRIDETG